MNCHHICLSFSFFCRYLHTVRCPHTVTVYDVLQVAETKCRMSEQSGNKILGKQNPNFTGSHTRQTSLKTNYSIRDDSSETSQGQHAKQTRASDAQQGEISPVKSNLKSKTSRNETSKERTDLAECCKDCSSVEEFLKHLIWSEETNSEK